MHTREATFLHSEESFYLGRPAYPLMQKHRQRSGPAHPVMGGQVAGGELDSAEVGYCEACSFCPDAMGSWAC